MAIDRPLVPSTLAEAQATRDQQVTVMIVDDHEMAREGLRSMLKTNRQITVIGEARDGTEAIEKASSLKPTIILMDYKMAGLDGLAATRKIKAIHPTVSIIMMSSYEDAAIVVESVKAGASGYLVKDSSRELLVHTLLAVASGGVLVKASLLQHVFGFSADRNSRQASKPQSLQLPAVETLTSREENILRLIAEGKTNRAIADKMGFAEITIKKHVQEIIAKLYASDRTHAAIIAMRLGLIN